MLEIRNLISHHGRRKIINGVSVSVRGSSWFGIIGANGSGKTTFLKSISGRHSISSGSVLLNGKAIHLNRHNLAEGISFMPTINSLPNILTVDQVLNLVSPDVRNENNDIENVLDIASFRQNKIGQLSSGLKQRVCLGLAFRQNCKVVALDEPFNWLDPVCAFDLKELLSAKVKAGLTLVTAMHDISTFSRYCDSGLLMKQGGTVIEISSKTMTTYRDDPFGFEKMIVKRFRENE